MTWFQVAWVVLFTLGFVVEGFAIFNKIRRDTLSEQVWLLRAKRWGRAILMPFWGWLTWHFFLEPRIWDVNSGVWTDDWIIVASLFGSALAFNMYAEPSDN